MANDIKYQRRRDPDEHQYSFEELEQIEQEQSEKREAEIRKQYHKKRILLSVQREMTQNNPQMDFQSYEDYLNYAVSVKELCQSQIREISAKYETSISFDKKDITKTVIIAVIVFLLASTVLSYLISSIFLFNESNHAFIPIFISCVFVGAIDFPVASNKVRERQKNISNYSDTMKESIKKTYLDSAKKVKYLFNDTFLHSISNVPDDVSFVSNLPVTEDKRYIVYRAPTGSCYHGKSWCRGNALSPVNYFLIRDRLSMCSFCGRRFDNIEWYDKYTAMKKVQQYFVDAIPKLKELTQSTN